MSFPSSTSGRRSAACSRPELNAIRLFAQHYDELRRVAHHLRGRSASNTLTATGLVHEAYLHLHLHKDLTVQSKRHLLRLAACAMRQVLARHTRRSRAWKRGGRAALLPLPETAAGPRPPLLDVLMLDDALDALDRKHPR